MGITFFNWSMDRSFRHNGVSKQKKGNSIFTILSTILIALFLAGFRLGASYIHASENLDANYSYPNLALYSPEANYHVFSPKVVEIITMDSSDLYLVYGTTVSDILYEANIELQENDLTIPAVDKVVADKGRIQVLHIEIEYKVQKEEIPYKSVEKLTDEYNVGIFKVVQNGNNGLLAKTFKEVYQDGILISTDLVKTIVEKEAVEKITLVGTKPVTIKSCGYWGEVVDRTTSDERERKWMKFVMFKESGCDSGRLSRGTGFFKGLFQFAPATYRSKGGTDIFNGSEQIKIVHGMYQFGDRYLNQQWPASNKAFMSLYGGR